MDKLIVALTGAPAKEQQKANLIFAEIQFLLLRQLAMVPESEYSSKLNSLLKADTSFNLAKEAQQNVPLLASLKIQERAFMEQKAKLDAKIEELEKKEKKQPLETKDRDTLLASINKASILNSGLNAIKAFSETRNFENLVDAKDALTEMEKKSNWLWVF